MLSIISLVIQSSPTGRSEENRRETKPKTTTGGPESHTILRTGGTLRSAETRSRQPFQTFSGSAMPNPNPFYECQCKTDKAPTDCLGRRDRPYSSPQQLKSLVQT